MLNIHSRQNQIFMYVKHRSLHKIKHTIKPMVIVFVPQVSVSVWCRCTSVRSPPRTYEASWASFPAFTFVSESSSLRSWDSLNCWERYWHHGVQTPHRCTLSRGWLGNALSVTLSLICCIRASVKRLIYNRTG